MSEIEHELIDTVARELRQPVPLRPDFDRQVMAAIHREMLGAKRGRWRGWQLSVTLTPPRIAAAVAAMLGLVASSSWLLARGVKDAWTSASANASLPIAAPIIARVPGTIALREATGNGRAVQFVVIAPGAAQVTLVGDFNNWDSSATPMRLATDAGVWAVTVPLKVGRYQYAFVINGTEWRSDPTAPAAPVNDFGARNSIIAVTDRST